MYRLLEFIKLIYVFVIFVVLEVAALWSYATSSPYTEAKILARTTAVGASIISEVRYVVTKCTGTEVRNVNVYIDSMMID